MDKQKTVFISADHGLAIVYFLQTDVVKTLLEAGLRVVLLTDDHLLEKIRQSFGTQGLIIEGLRLQQARAYLEKVDYSRQWWLDFFRRAGASARMNLEAINSYVDWVYAEAPPKRRMLFPLVRLILYVLRHSSPARRVVVNAQQRYTPRLYTDLFEQYQPTLVVASTPGWRLDRYLLREANARGVRTAAIVLGWDNPSSYALPGAKVEYISCWSEIQKHELMVGSDWQEDRIHIGGIPSYDGYFRREWLLPREQYFQMHGLDPNRKLLSYACSFVTFSPNIQNIEAIARLIAQDQLAAPCQLLIRLHPNHFMENKRWSGERQQIYELTRRYPHVHVVEPVPLGGELGYYSGEDMHEKSSMMAHSDVFLTVYSTMVVETSIHETPIISVTIDAPKGWPGKYSLPLSQIGEWPTHQRFRLSGAGRVASNEGELKQAINDYLLDPQRDQEAQQNFIRKECTFTDGQSGKRTGAYLAQLAYSTGKAR
jgi:CDP-glycerol glycerophosphotransferase (TagB/SpsB family)